MFFSTRGISATERGPAWKNMLSRHCAPFLTDANAARFEASMDARMIGPLSCSRISQTASTVYRRLHEIYTCSPPAIVLIIQVAGRSVMCQAGHELVLTSGVMTVFDLQRPLTMTFDGKSTQLALHLPKDRLRVPEGQLASLLAQGLPDAVGSVIGPLIRASFDQLNRGGTCAAKVAEAIVVLLDAAFGRTLQPDHADPLGSGLFQAIQDYAGRNLHEDLTAARIAKANNISERTLQRLYLAHGLSVSHSIRDNRLERCALDLSDREMEYRTVADIAYSWGFNSVSHFSRIFSAHFGKSPSEYRATALHGACIPARCSRTMALDMRDR